MTKARLAGTPGSDLQGVFHTTLLTLSGWQELTARKPRHCVQALGRLAGVEQNETPATPVGGLLSELATTALPIVHARLVRYKKA